MNFFGKENSIYIDKAGKEKSLRLYDSQMSKLGVPFSDLFVNTRFGKTHIVETGNLSGKPLLIFHGGNSTSAYNLLMCRFLLNAFHVYAVDTIGHPGKSAEVCISPRGYDYGKWASEVISELGFKKIRCFGGSFGGGILAKLMCVSPEKVDRSVLIVPAGISNAFPISTAKMLIPLVKYRLTGKREYLIQTCLHMSVSRDVLDEDTLDTVKDSFDNVKTKVGMPSDVSPVLLKKCKAPTLVIAAEKDCLFPARKVLLKAKKMLKGCKTMLLRNRGHLHILTEREKDIIVNFLDC